VLVEDGSDVLKVARYIEANPVAAGIVRRAEDYKWSSISPLARRRGRPALEPTLVERTGEWRKFVNEPLAAESVQQIEDGIRKGIPIGSAAWRAQVVAEHGLQHVMRSRGRPRVYDVVEL
jgi:putative transposase